jgi:hypothetical protein
MSTEQQGPFFIEYGANTIIARSKQPFSGTVEWEVQAEKQAAIYALPPMGFQEGMKLTLHTDGYEDVVIEQKGDSN